MPVERFLSRGSRRWQNPQCPCFDNRLHSAIDTEFAVNIPGVDLDCIRREVKPGSDFPTGQSLSHEDTFFAGLVAYGTGKAALLCGDLDEAVDSFRVALKDAAETGYRRVMKYSLQALAVCALESGQIERAVRLHGLIAFKDWLLWPMSMPWQVPYDLEGLLAPYCASMGEAEYDRLNIEGQTMTLEQALADAL